MSEKNCASVNEAQNASSTTSAVSSNSDRVLTVYVDDKNGASGGVTGRSVTSTYVRLVNGTALAAVALDRLVATQATLSPESTVTGANFGVSLRDQPLNLLIAIDLLPAIVAQLQIVYRAVPDGVRLGLVHGSTNPNATFFPNIVKFFKAVDTTHPLGLLPNPDVACKCPRGFYYEIQDGACVRCAAGSYCIAGMKRQCPDGTFSFEKAVILCCFFLPRP
ncbi:hypothetical protein PHPALM_9768 [Phytophthora palmivora]|uniref:Uncharacterized protein n=1 Tax=Phytophthora palmivora TaxID=4796 RepID=A0A2P4Y6F2_9STRA|nr:hypothetical protein PHPALM_9768 [Phytophthora palmivora]